MPGSITIQKKPSLPQSGDYNFLRQKGLEYIQDLGSKIWTDYNIHDPGITMLEALCYAITDLGYRTSLDIKDLLALLTPELPDVEGQYAADKRQAFFTARNILTINPLTTSDFRKLLINIDGVKNGWLNCKHCPCDDIYLYANCEKSSLQYEDTHHEIVIKGLYDVLVEFEDDDKCGNLNSGKIKYNFSFSSGLNIATATLELRLPSWAKLETNKNKYKSFRLPESEISNVQVDFISGNKGDNFDIPIIPESILDNALRKPLFATITVTFKPDKQNPATEIIVFEDAAINIWCRSTEERRALQLADIKLAIQDKTSSGILSKYHTKILEVDRIIALTKSALHSHRNLCEDFCTVKAIEVEDIAICMDMDVEPSADIEAILGEAYYKIDQYFSPDIQFYSLQQLMDEHIPVDEIFEGPPLKNGFIKNDELLAAALRTELRSSDVINILMDIPGVIAIKNFVFVRYDDDGRLVETESWKMNISPNHQPRLYLDANKTLVFKNGLPFLADRNELLDTISNAIQIFKGRNMQPKYAEIDNDLPVPHGNHFDLEIYYPVQYSLPLNYGTGYAGLPATATEERKAQAKQLKAYLLFFEQMLVNYFSQLSHIDELFAIDHTVSQTYFSRCIETTEIDGLSELYNGFDGNKLRQLIENKDQFLDRRNRFLDHLLSRFAEQFNDYALMLYSYTNDKQIADDELIKSKIDYLQNFPEISANRAKSFNYKDPAFVCSSLNKAGLVKRIELLLGFGSPYTNYIQLYEEKDTDGKLYERRWRLIDKEGKIHLSSSTRYVDTTLENADAKAWDEIHNVFLYIRNAAQYTIKKGKKYVLNLVDNTNEVIATRKQYFNNQEEAEIARDEIIDFAKSIYDEEQVYLVEHLLLRPRNQSGLLFPDGDPLLDICIPSDCSSCGEEDPYSFRFTVVLNGEAGLAAKGLEFRHFAEQTIRKESPAHLALKICWVSTEQLVEFAAVYCAWLEVFSRDEPDAKQLHDRLTDLLHVFKQLKNVYPPAQLHDCVDGNDDIRVFLGHTAITSNEALDEQMKRKK